MWQNRREGVILWTVNFAVMWLVGVERIGVMCTSAVFMRADCGAFSQPHSSQVYLHLLRIPPNHRKKCPKPVLFFVVCCSLPFHNLDMNSLDRIFLFRQQQQPRHNNKRLSAYKNINTKHHTVRSLNGTFRLSFYSGISNRKLQSRDTTTTSNHTEHTHTNIG